MAVQGTAHIHDCPLSQEVPGTWILVKFFPGRAEGGTPPPIWGGGKLTTKFPPPPLLRIQLDSVGLLQNPRGFRRFFWFWLSCVTCIRPLPCLNGACLNGPHVLSPRTALSPQKHPETGNKFNGFVKTVKRFLKNRLTVLKKPSNGF